ncbi:MAG: ATP-binding cassette domain-containing protein [Candidatus Krumholzibacteriia bacterium]
MPAEPLVSLRGWALQRQGPQAAQPILAGIDLDVHPGQWLALLGANGTGKSSLLKWLASDDSPVGDRAAIVFQDPDDQLVAATVAGELALGRPGLDTARAAAAWGLAGLEDLDPRVLAAGQKQRLALAVALAGEPTLLLCDEPTALQDSTQAAWVLDELDAWRRGPGRALVTATCDRAEAARADRLVVLAGGRIVAAGPPAELLDGPLVGSLLGLDAPARPPRPAVGAPVLRCREVVCRFRGPGGGFGPLELEVRAGERVGLVGPNGCGKSTLLAVAAGLRAPDGGSVWLGDRRLDARRGPDLAHGRAMLAPQFPEYAFARPTVAAELALDPAFAGVDPGAWLAALGLPPAAAAADPHDLSTGQRRRLALGLALGSGRPLVLLDEPTAALDRDGRRMVLDLLDQAGDGAGLVIASHDRAFLAAAGCRLVELNANTGDRSLRRA